MCFYNVICANPTIIYNNFINLLQQIDSNHIGKFENNQSKNRDQRGREGERERERERERDKCVSRNGDFTNLS
jgi:hypothetical protein